MQIHLWNSHWKFTLEIRIPQNPNINYSSKQKLYIILLIYSLHETCVLDIGFWIAQFETGAIVHPQNNTNKKQHVTKNLVELWISPNRIKQTWKKLKKIRCKFLESPWGLNSTKFNSTLPYYQVWQIINNFRWQALVDNQNAIG